MNALCGNCVVVSAEGDFYVSTSNSVESDTSGCWISRIRCGNRIRSAAEEIRDFSMAAYIENDSIHFWCDCRERANYRIAPDARKLSYNNFYVEV